MVAERVVGPARADGAEAGRTAGPVSPTATSRAVLHPLDFHGVRLDESGLLGSIQELNRTRTIDHCVANMESAGNLDNIRRLIGESDADFTGFWFADSDIYKVVEAVGWERGRSGATDWDGFLQEVTRLLRAAQEDDGYLNSWIQGVHPERRWLQLEESHEMYCAGHLFQAAVAVARTGDGEELLDVACRLADLLVREFGEGATEGIDGHPEVETALVELYRHTRREDYLALASRIVELRGRGLLPGGRFGSQYLQDHAPVREATEAIGHAVRQLYLAAGVTDVYLETGDESLLRAMEKLWTSTFTEKTYITGAHGSRHRDEAFGDPFELPADRAYAETCAAIASFQWNWRMLLATGEARYAEEMERVLYNGIAVATSVDGSHFFYSNPLHLRPGHDGSTEDAPSERLSWYACACCPPNLARLAASLHHYVATGDDAGVQLHLLTASTVAATRPDGSVVRLTVSTDLPWDGAVTIRVEEGDGEWTLAVRRPAWSDDVRLTVAGEEVSAEAGEDGYIRVTRHWEAGAEVRLDIALPVRLVRANPRVDAVRGCVAIARGPVVYAVEQVDQEDGVVVDDLRIDPTSPPEPAGGIDELGVPVTLVGPARALQTVPDSLYAAAHDGVPATRSTTVTAIPYFRWANRGETAMRVWIPTQ